MVSYVTPYDIVVETVEVGEVPEDGGVRGGCSTARGRLAGEDGLGHHESFSFIFGISIINIIRVSNSEWQVC